MDFAHFCTAVEGRASGSAQSVVFLNLRAENPHGDGELYIILQIVKLECRENRIIFTGGLGINCFSWCKTFPMWAARRLFVDGFSHVWSPHSCWWFSYFCWPNRTFLFWRPTVSPCVNRLLWFAVSVVVRNDELHFLKKMFAASITMQGTWDFAWSGPEVLPCSHAQNIPGYYPPVN